MNRHWNDELSLAADFIRSIQTNDPILNLELGEIASQIECLAAERLSDDPKEQRITPHMR